jgi:hypothetical protein
VKLLIKIKEGAIVSFDDTIFANTSKANLKQEQRAEEIQGF